MGRISASGAQDLYNAYASVYTQHPQEETLTEEQIVIDEFCESWFQQCIDEGVDFSQYSYDVILEAICEAMGQEMGTPTKPSVFSRIGSFLQKKLRGQGNQPLRQPGDPGRTSQPTTRIDRSSSTSAPAPNPAATSRPAPNPAATSRPAPSAATPAAKPEPAATPAAKPEPAATPATKPSTSVAGTVKPVPGAPTQSSLATARPAQKPEQALSKLPGGNYSAAATKLMSQRTKNILGTTKTPATRLGGARERMLNQDLDLFDIVKGHLMSEGYADTEEAALAIMANMSEEWKQTILEADSVDKMRERAEKRRKQRYGKQGGGGRDDYRPYTEDDYKNPKPGYGSSQVKPA